MRKNKKKRKPSETGTIAVYYRLLKEFAKPYWFKLLLGVFAGFVIGGAMSATLRIMDLGLNAFEAGIKSGAAEQPAPILKIPLKKHNPEKASPKRQPIGHIPAAQVGQEQAENRVSAVTPAPPELLDSIPNTIKKRNRLLQKINALFDRFGIDLTIEQEQALTLPVVVLLISILFAFFALQSVGELMNRYYLRWVGSRVVTDMRISLFDKMQHQSLAFFSQNEVGKLISRCTNDTNAIERVIANSIPELCTAPIFILVAGQFIISKTREAELQTQALLMILFLPFCVIPIYLLSRYLKNFEKKVLERISSVTSRMLESFNGIRVVKSFNQEKYEYDRFHEINEDYFKSLQKAILADVLVHPTMQLSAIALASVFVLICYRYQVSFATLAVIGFAAQQAYKPIKDLAKINASLQKSAAAADRIFEILDTDSTLPLAAHPVHLKTFNSEIVFEQVTFSYAPDEKNILHDLNLRIPKGSLVAVVGQTGSGKSTMANLLARFYDPCQGKITIDGQDLRDLDLQDFRNLVGIVSQDTFLFNDSIADNIRYGKREASLAEIQAAAEQANACEFIQADPSGYDRKVGERGNLLSGGQKQRLAIARAILKNPPILILDEATSALDTVTEHLVQEALNNVMHDRTVLAIAHRLSTIKKADTILVIEQGRIIEQGNHHELYQLNGNYRRLYDMQFADREDPENNS
ncbi:MAG: ABC transporter ATP-binding protein [Lentisphaeria bacterium]